MSGRRLSTILMSLAFVLSIAYNALWIAAADDILDVSCISQFASVHAAALDARRAEDWPRAAHLFAYLAEFHPRSEGGCSLASSMKGPWALPLWAISVNVQRPGRSSDATIRAADEQLFSDAYRDAATRAGFLIQRSASVPKVDPQIVHR